MAKQTSQISVEQLFEANAHIGHQTSRWNPKMAGFIYGSEKEVHLFDLVKTKEAIDVALSFLSQALRDGQRILFVSSKKALQPKVTEVAEALSQPFVNERWLGGTLTNFEQIKRSVRKLADLRQSLTNGEFADYTKKERLLIDREIIRLNKIVGGLAALSDLPHVLFVCDLKECKGAAKEAKSLNIPVVAICDTNADPDLADYVIPMNDDAISAIEMILDEIKALKLSKTVEKKETKAKK